ncbi:hypothetical protein IJ472_05075 [bacterium]|nr:hypothetical protein [bacterium]
MCYLYNQVNKILTVIYVLDRLVAVTYYRHSEATIMRFFASLRMAYVSRRIS